MLNLVDYKLIDENKIVGLRSQHSDDPFCQTFYFNAVCDTCLALVLNDYQGVLLVPYKRLGPWRWSLTPLFYRYSQWLGSWSAAEQGEALKLLMKHFHFGDLNLGANEVLASNKFHQALDAKNYTLDQCNTQARRMIRKAEGQGIQFTSDLEINSFVSFLSSELGDRVEGMHHEAMERLKALLSKLKAAGKLRFEGAILGGVLIGGILTVELEGRHMYLKGTATHDAKRLGTYYLLMHRAILRARDAQVIFDFGGSGVDGVARFNRNFGAHDVAYSNYSWGKQPYFYKLLKRLRTKWKSKSA